MSLLTLVLLAVGALAVVASWTAAAHMIASVRYGDRAAARSTVGQPLPSAGSYDSRPLERVQA